MPNFFNAWYPSITFLRSAFFIYFLPVAMRAFLKSDLILYFSVSSISYYAFALHYKILSVIFFRLGNDLLSGGFNL